VGGDIIGALMRVVLEAMFWWWHPLTPVYRRAPRRTSKRSRRSAKKDDVPFYEKVNRFVFGEEAPQPSAEERQKTLLNEIRAQNGVVGPSDVMRLFNVTRSEAEAMLVKAMLDFDGDVKVSDEGGITYHFERARKSAMAARGATSKGLGFRLCLAPFPLFFRYGLWPCLYGVGLPKAAQRKR